MSTAQKTTLRCRGTWEEATRSRLSVRRFPEFITDEPKPLGGTDMGPNPMEYMLAGLNGCVTVMIHVVGAEMKFAYEAVDTVADGDLDLRGLAGDPNVQAHFLEIRQKVRIKTSETPERLAELKAKVESRCPAVSLFNAAKVPVVSKWEIV